MTTTRIATETLLYTQTTGCTAIIDGERGTTTGFHYTQNRTDGAFIKLDDGGMVYVELAKTAEEKPSHRVILSSRRITRDDFDRLNSIDAFRTELGWRA